MAENTKIEWADHTFNPWIGCTKVGPGCDNCYAEADFDKRRHVVTWGAGKPRKLTGDSTWAQPRRWNAQAQREGKRYRVFCASLADVFDNEVPAAWRQELFNLISVTPHLDWLLLTKRIGNVTRMLDESVLAGWDANAWPNVWIGATICNQEEADRDIPKLLAVPAAKRFLSMEPLLGPVDLTAAYLPCPTSAKHGPMMDMSTGSYECCRKCDFTGIGAEMGIDWVIVGGESGPNARPMHPDWARSLRDQCQADGVPFLFKQWGEHVGGELQPNPIYPDDGSAWRLDQCGRRWHQAGEGYLPREDWKPIRYIKVGKKAAGRLLDGHEWNEVPA